MNAVILAPGPSLMRFDEAQFGDALVIAVNRAAFAFASTIWACLDIMFFDKFRSAPLGRPALLVEDNAFNQLQRNAETAWRGERICADVLNDSFPLLPRVTLYSATAALAFAAFLGAKRIDVFGVDWSGVEDWDGVEAGANRTYHRWKSESELWRGIVETIRPRGQSVRRYGFS